MEQQPMVEHALDYAKQGFSVIPVAHLTKKALVKWREYQTRIASEEQIRAWWQQYPKAGIGVITGRVSNLVVLDADVDKQGANLALLHEVAPTQQIVKTGAGYHLWLRYPEGCDYVPTLAGVLQSAVGPGIDVRGDGGYVVAPPSQHQNGNFYSWIERGEWGTLPPGVLLSLLEQHKRRPDQAPRTEIGAGDGLPNSDEQWLSQILAGVGAGQRNQSLTRLIGYFAAKNVPVDVAAKIACMWDVNNRPSLREEDPAQWDRTVQSVYSLERAKQRAMQGLDGTTHLDFTFSSLDEFMAEYGDVHTRWLVDGWLPMATTGLVVSPPAGYKTWLLLDLAISVASGTPFLGHFPVRKPGTVLFIQQEDAFTGLADRISQIVGARLMDLRWMQEEEQGEGIFRFCLPPSLPVYFHNERALKFGDDWSTTKLRQAVARYEPVLVIIDPLYSTTSTDDYMASAAGDMMVLKHLRDQFNTSFLIAHHTKKSPPGLGQIGAVREGAWGSQFLNAWLETGWQIRSREGHGAITVQRHFKTSGLPDLIDLDFVIDEDTLTYAVEVGDTRTVVPVKKEKVTQGPGPERDTHPKKARLPVEEVVIGLLLQRPHTVSEMIRACPDWSENSVRLKVRHMADVGLIEMVPGALDTTYRFISGKAEEE